MKYLIISRIDNNFYTAFETPEHHKRVNLNPDGGRNPLNRLHESVLEYECDLNNVLEDGYWIAVEIPE